MAAPIATIDMAPEERALLSGDLSKLSSDQRATLVASVCRSVGLNPLTRPLEYITLNGRLTLYARKDCTDQLRSLHNVSIAIDSKEQIGDLYIVTVRAFLPSGRSDSEIGAVATAGLRGEALANAMMKAITKAKRRATLSICGLGFLDELETETIPGAQVWQEPAQQAAAPRQLPRTTDTTTGEVQDDGQLPPTAKMIATLRDMWQQLAADDPDLPEPNPVNRQQARNIKTYYVGLLADAESAVESVV